MNISEIKIKLLGDDILSIFNEFVKIDGLNLKSVLINNGIVLNGSFKKIINIDFSLKVELIECIENKIIIKVIKAKALNIRFFRVLRSFIIKQLSKVLKKYGIESEKDKIIINIKETLKNVPYVDLIIDDIFIKKSEIWVEAKDINISILGQLKKEQKDEEVRKNEESKELEDLKNINKIKDNYSVGRDKIIESLLNKSSNYKEYLFLLPDIISLIYRLLKDERVPMKTKLIMSTGIAYVTVPSNIIPNSIPFIGVIDDLGVIFFVLNKIVEDIPMNVIAENWEGENDILLVLKKGIEYLTNFTNASNIEKLYGVIQEISTL